MIEYVWARALAAVGLSVLSFGATAETNVDTRPNFIFIYTDDQQFAALGENGNRHIQTPNLDAFAKSAVRFENAYAVFALCAPSRAAALTGQYGSRNGKQDFTTKLKPEARNFAHHFKEAGYATSIVGKWHLERTPEDSGFDRVVSFWANGTYYGRKVSVDGVTKTSAKRVDEFCVDRSVVWLWERSQEGGPPYHLQSRNRVVAQEEYGYGDANKLRSHARSYYAVVTEVDSALGRLLDQVEELGFRENTWIFVMSDNGWLLGEHGMTSKVLAYEESIQVPLMIAGPGLEPGVRSEIALNIDIAPTLLELAGIEIPSSMQGRSLVPVLERKAEGWREAFVYEGLGTYANLKRHLAAVGTRWKLIRTLDDKDPARVVFDELYDLVKDPHEMDNLADAEEHAVQKETPAAAIDAHLAELGREALRTVNRGGDR